MKSVYKIYCIYAICGISLLLTNETVSQNVKVTKVSDDVIILHPRDVLDLSIVREVGGTVTAVQTDSGIVVVDSFGSLECAKQARELINDYFPDSKFKYLICSHHHSDHIRGNQYFSDACIIAHARVEQYMREEYERLHRKYGCYQEKIDSLENVLITGKVTSQKETIEKELAFWKYAKNFLKTYTLALPNININSNTILKVGGKIFEILFGGTAHTDNDLVILDREDRLLIMCDLFCYRKCYLMNSESDARNWIAILNKLIARRGEYDYVIPGHCGTIEKPDALIEQRDYLVDLCEYVEKAIKDNMNLEQAMKNVQLEQYENYWMYDKIVLDVEAYWKQLERRN